MKNDYLIVFDKGSTKSYRARSLLDLIKLIIRDNLIDRVTNIIIVKGASDDED